jgi:Flp pilus assembly pilin Flp
MLECDSGATAFENGLIAVLAILAAVTIIGQVEGSIRGVFSDSAVQNDTDWQLRRH